MSHNSLAVNSSAPDQAGIITTPSVFLEIRVGGGSLSDNYSNSGASSINNSILYFYDTNPVNTITGATLSSSNNWVSAVTLPAGTYLMEAAFSVVFSATGQFAYQWYDGTNSRGTRAQVGGTLSHATESASPLAVLCIELETSTTFNVKSTAASTNLESITNHSTTPSEQSYFRIKKLS